MSSTDTRGVTRRDYFAWLLFRALARGDFHHDFGERVATRDLITAGDENRFFEIAKLISKKGAVFLRTEFKKYIGKTLYEILADKIDRILPLAPSPRPAQAPAGFVEPKPFPDEVDLLLQIGVNFAAIKAAAQVAPPGTILTNTFPQLGTFSIPSLGETRDYSIGVGHYRRGERGTPEYSQLTNVMATLQAISGGRTKFAFVVDASGGLPLSEVRNALLDPPPATPGEVNFIYNIEYAGDSATGVTQFPKKEDPTKGRIAPTVRLLRDKVTSVIYPLWSATFKDQKENVYSTLKVVLTRISASEIQATILVIDPSGAIKESYEIGDIATASNVKNATLRALAVFIEKGIGATEGMVYALLKRMGDWCQALSLLDLDRPYTVHDDSDRPIQVGAAKGGAKPLEVTLRSMMVDTEIAIVTNDRILLAFCILLGLNVMYTTAMDIARVLYFKNKRDIPEGAALQTAIQTKEADVQARLTDKLGYALAEHQTLIQATIAKVKYALSNAPSAADYILRAKLLLSTLGKLRYEFTTTMAQILATRDMYASLPAGSRAKYDAVNSIDALITKLETDMQSNTQIVGESIVRDPAAPQGFKLTLTAQPRTALAIRTDALRTKLAAGGRMSKSVEMKEAKDILLTVRDDLKQVLEKKLPGLDAAGLAALIPATFPIPAELSEGAKARLAENHAELETVLPALRAALGIQTGGGAADVKGFFDAIRAREIRILPAGTPEVTSTTNIYSIGDSYYDEKLNAYTVADEFIVTADDVPVFDKVFTGASAADAATFAPPSMPPIVYFCLRYFLLECDIHLNRLDTLNQDLAGLEKVSVVQKTPVGPGQVLYTEVQQADREDPGVLEPGTVGDRLLRESTEVAERLSVAVNNVKLAALPAMAGSAWTAALALRAPVGVDKRVPLSLLMERYRTIRTDLMALIAKARPPPADERAETVQLEATVAANFTAVPPRVSRYSLPIVQRLLLPLGIVVRNVVNQAEAMSLGQAIESALQRVGLDLAGTDQTTASPTMVVQNGAEQIVSAVVVAIEQWVLSQPDARRAGIDVEGVRASVSVFVRDIRATEQTEAANAARLQAASAAQSNAGVGSPSGSVPLGRGGRRGLYARLRQRARTGGPPGVRE